MGTAHNPVEKHEEKLTDDFDQLLAYGDNVKP